ncbi:MAG: tetrapyrrole methylase, partial [Chloroflexi bacterium]|nr:tetrapyrrole methylase [Chloroflexota bacterium]
SSLMATLSVLDFPIQRFVFGGFLPRDERQRAQELQRLKSLRMPVVLMDTPYRLGKLLGEISSAFGKNQLIMLACDLTLPTETIYRGRVVDVQKWVGKRKAEFLLVTYPPGTTS